MASDTDGATRQLLPEGESWQPYRCDDCRIVFAISSEIVTGAWKCPVCGDEDISKLEEGDRDE